MVRKRYRRARRDDAGAGAAAVALSRYVAGACLARVATEGVAIALVVVVRAAGSGAATAGLLIAAWSGPSIVTGPLAGHALDRARRPALVIAGAAALAAAALAVDALALGRAPLAVVTVATVAGGMTVPLLTGGTSSLLAALVPAAMLARAQALDAATYNVSGIAGPALVALLASVWSPRTALVVPAVAVFAGALLLPAARRPASGGERPRLSPRATLRAIGDTPQLRASTAASTVAAFGWGGLEIGAVAIAAATGAAHLAGVDLAVLAAAALAAALVLARVPLRRPDPAIGLALVTMAAGAAVIAVAPSPALVAIGFALFGAGDGVLLPAVLAVRARDAPAAMAAAVFTTAASLKTAAGALGAGVAGLAASGLGARGLFVALAVSQLAAAALARAPAGDVRRAVG